MEDTNIQADPQALLERLMKGETADDIAKAASPAVPPAAPAPVLEKTEAPAAPAQTVTPPAPAAESDEVKALRAEIGELTKRFGGLRSARDERVEKLTKEIEELKAKQTDEEKQRKLADLDAQAPEGYADFAPILEHAQKRAEIVAPPPPAEKAAQMADDDAVKWWNEIAEEVSEFPSLMTDESFKQYVATRLASEGIGHKWARPAFVVANVSRLHADFQKAKGAAATMTANNQQHSAGSEIPEGVPGPRPSAQPKTKVITLSQLNELMLDPKSKFGGRSLSECMKVFEAEGYALA